MVNATPYPFEPRLFSDPEDDSFNVDADENRVYLNEPVLPGQMVELTFTCAEAGAIETDHAYESIPLHNEPGEDFRTSVEVNGCRVDDWVPGPLRPPPVCVSIFAHETEKKHPRHRDNHA